MVEVVSLSDNNKIEKLYNKLNINYASGISAAMAAVENEKEIGLCLFDIVKSEKIIIKYISPINDLSMADGMLRSALFLAANRGIMEAYWSEPVSFELINKLGFVQNPQNCSIDITKLFSSCENCKKL